MTVHVPLWSRVERTVAGILAGAGLLIIAVARFGSGGGTDLDEQIGWLNLAVVGLVVSLIGLGVFLIVGRRSVAIRRRSLLPEVVPTGVVRDAQHRSVDTWLWIEGTQRAHHAGCQLVFGKQAVIVRAAEIRRRALRRCELCG